MRNFDKRNSQKSAEMEYKFCTEKSKLRLEKPLSIIPIEYSTDEIEAIVVPSKPKAKPGVKAKVAADPMDELSKEHQDQLNELLEMYPDEQGIQEDYDFTMGIINNLVSIFKFYLKILG